VLALLILDTALVLAGLPCCAWLRGLLAGPLALAPASAAAHWPVVVAAAPLLVLAHAWLGLYRIERAADALRAWTRAAQATVAVALLGTILLFFAPGYRSGFLYSRSLLLLLFVWLLVAPGLVRVLIRAACARAWSRGRLLRRAVLVGEEAGLGELASTLAAGPGAGYRVCAVLPLTAPELEEQAAQREAERLLLALLDRERPEAVLLTGRSLRALVPLALQARARGLEVQLLTGPDLPVFLARRPGELAGRPALEISRPPLDPLKQLLKRALDLTLASAGLLVAAPLLVVLGLAVRVHDGAPALFVQTRVGRSGRRFRIIKLRTMTTGGQPPAGGNIAEGPLTRIPDDPRVTRLGAWLRRHKLDELPQLINVIQGRMSLVGPRPPTEDEVQRYTPWQRGRLHVRPGLTGLWQIDKQRRWRFDEMVELDLQYIVTWSLLLDAGVLLRTIPAVLRGS